MRLLHPSDHHFDPRSDHLRFFSARTLRGVLAGAGFAELRVRSSGRPPHGLHAVAR